MDATITIDTPRSDTAVPPADLARVRFWMGWTVFAAGALHGLAEFAPRALALLTGGG